MPAGSEIPGAADVQPWRAAGWLPGVQDWIEAACAAQGLRPAGPAVEIHRRHWSVVLRVPLRPQDAFFKATVRGLTHEAAVVGLLAELAPECLPPVVAIDPARGWLLTLDAGPSLGDTVPVEDRAAIWQAVLPAYARLQQRSATIASRLLDVGVFDRRPERLAGQMATLLAHLECWVPAGMLTRDEQDRLEAAAIGLTDSARALAALGIPDGIQVDDLHAYNLAVGAAGPRLIDWGDACLGHPFGSLLVLETRLGEDLAGVPAAAPMRARVRSGYLAAWSAWAAPEVLARAVELVSWSAPAVRALTWAEVLRACGDEALRERGASVAHWLRRWLAHPAPR